MDIIGTISIVLLNYNGCDDTIECLNSILYLDYDLFNVILIDNDSHDQSVQRIYDWARNKFSVDIHSKVGMVCRENFSYLVPDNAKFLPNLTIITNTANLGFAAGCNQGMELALSSGAEYIWLLNNDTVVETDSLFVLADYLKKHSDCQVASPQIRLYDEPNLIWNCGGELKWYGARKYHYVHRPVSELPDTDTLDITFVTGCAPLIRSALIQRLGGFTEKFFFGEEDFEFSLRMKKERVKMVCCLKSVIYHKVGASIDNSTKNYNLGKAYIHYLNRFINLRNYWPSLCWHVWRVSYSCYIFILLGRLSQCSITVRSNFIKKLFKESAILDAVDKQTFDQILQADSDYFLSA